MLEQKEDILLEFKRKVNEAILLVSKIPVDQKAEVWNFWELITLTVKLCTQVYVEDSSKQLHYTSQNKIDNDKKLTQISQPNLIRLKKSPIHHYKLCQDDTQAEESKDYGQDLEHTDNESVKSFVKTLDFTDLISCPGSVDNVSSQDGTCSMFFSPPCSTPSGVALAQSVDSSSCSATPHTPRTGDDDHRYNFSSVSDENVEKILDNDSITKREKDDSVDEIKDITSYSDTEKYLENEIVVFVDHSNDLKSVEHSDTIDEIGTTADEERAEDVKISESEESGVGSQTLQLNEECGDNGKNEANLESCNNQNTSISQVNQKGKENKIPLLKIRKSKKLGEATETFEDKQVSSGVRYLNRKSDRKRTEVRHDEFVYEVVEASHRTAKRSPHSLIVGSGSNKLKCNECGKVLSNRTSLKVHMRQHSGQRPFSCTVCGKTFSTNGNKLRHEKSHKGDKEYQCPECQKWFSSTRSLQIHQRTHTGERPYKCNVCEKRFTQQGSLSAHMDLHNGEKRFLCTVCGKSFTQKSNLESHMLRHDSENKQFKCEHCSYSFFTKAELERHVFKHTKEKPFLCDYCPKSFTRVQYLKEHKTMHVKPRPYSCHKCDETFPDVALLRKHKHWHRVKEYQNSKGEITQSHEQEGEIIEQYTQEDLDIHQTCIVTTSEITGMKQIIMTSDKDLPADLLQQFVDSGQVDSEAMEVTHIVPVVQEMDHDGNLKEAETIDDGSQDVYQITFLDTNSDSENSNIIATVDLKDLKAMNLLANATTQH